MSTFSGPITSLGDYTTITTTIVNDDGMGNKTVGAFDQQKERFIDGLTIGGKTFGRLSCPSNLYPYFEKDKEAIIYTWMHPFLGFPPIRTGIIGIAYPGEDRAYIISKTQMVLSLTALALLPLLWFIPAIIVGGISSVILPRALSALVIVLVMFSPWIAGAWMAYSWVRMTATYPRAVIPKMN